MLKQLVDLASVTIYTGSNGKKGCKCNCIGCSQKKYGETHGYYQGRIEQIEELTKIAPNLTKAIILGNPDPNVDTEFCNEAAKLLVNQGVKVRFSSSGFNAEDTVKKLLSGLKPEDVDYMSFSIDSIDEKELSKLRGQKIYLKEINKALDYCKNKGFKTKIQPTLWDINCEEYLDIMRYFGERGVRWFSYHAGSFESFEQKIKGIDHVAPVYWRKITEDLSKECNEKKYSLHIPYLFMFEDEYKNYLKISDKCYPDKLKNTQIWLEDSYIRTTHCPLLREVREYDYNLYDLDKSKLNMETSQDGYCPVTPYSLGENLIKKSIDGQGFIFQTSNGENLYTICRSYNMLVNL